MKEMDVQFERQVSCTHSDPNKIAVIEFHQCKTCPEVLYSFNKSSLNVTFQLDEWNKFVKDIKRNFNVVDSETVTLPEDTTQITTTNDDLEFVCETCFQIFLCPLKYKEHRETHLKRRPFQCMICERRFSKKELLDKHLTLHKQKKTKKKSKSKSQRNQKKRNGTKPNQQEPASKETKDTLSDSTHISSHETDTKKKYKCGYCGKLFISNSKLTCHIRVHTGEKPFHCEVCGKEFRGKSSLTKHYLTHTGEKNHVCDVCGKSFSVTSHLKRHYITHTGEKSFSCKICGERFKYPYNLKQHSRVHTGETHKCDKCEISFIDGKSLNKHKKIHRPSKEPPSYECTVCGKKYGKPSLLARHMGIHTGERPHECEVCGKTYGFPSELEKHKRTHTGEKPFICEVCGKGFNDKRNRDRHLRNVHKGSDKPPLHCDTCGEAFTDLASLADHSKTHEGDDVNKCAVCGKTFTEASELVNHYQLHKKLESQEESSESQPEENVSDAPPEVHECAVCGKKFSESSDLVKHYHLHRANK